MRTPTPWELPALPAGVSHLGARGVTPRMIATRVARGELIRLRRGIYLAKNAWPDDEAARHLMLARAEVTANPTAVISHESAAVAWHLPSPAAPWHESPVSVTVPAGSGLSGARVVGVHHVARLPREHVDRDEHGYRVTTVARTAVDLSAALDVPHALVVLDAAARQLCARFVAEPRRSDYSNPRLAATARQQLADVATTCRHSSLRRVIALAEPARESVPESLSAGWFVVAGLPSPEYQARLRTPAGPLFPDCYWRAQNLIGECDGAVKYADARAIVAEKQREQVLRDQGYRIVRWLAEEIMFRPQQVIDRVRRALGE